MAYRTQFTGHEFVATPSGSPRSTTYILDIDGNIVEESIEETEELIQCYKDSGNVELILEKFALGDDSYLNASPGMYGDITGFQDDTIHDLDAKYKRSIAFYESLPDDIRADFPTPEKFYENFSYDDWQKILHGTDESAPSPVQDPVVDDTTEV